MKFLNDTKLIYIRSLTVTIRNPVFVIFGLFNPLCYLFLFAPLLKSLTHVPGFPPGGSLTMFVPGVLIMIALSSSFFVGFGLLDDMRAGVLERFKVTPLSRASILVGMVLRDVTVILLQSLLLLFLAFLFFGLRMNLVGSLATLLLVGMIGAAITSFSYSLAVALGNEDALAATVNFFFIPLQLLSGSTLPLSLAPSWLQWLAFMNPLAHAVNAARVLCVGNFFTTIVLMGFGAVILLAGGLITWGVLSFNKTDK